MAIVKASDLTRTMKEIKETHEGKIPKFENLKAKASVCPFDVWIVKVSCSLLRNTFPTINNNPAVAGHRFNVFSERSCIDMCYNGRKMLMQSWNQSRIQNRKIDLGFAPGYMSGNVPDVVGSSRAIKSTGQRERSTARPTSTILTRRARPPEPTRDEQVQPSLLSMLASTRSGYVSQPQT